jgi:hypothetical protein
MSGTVTGVDANVVFREIAGPEARATTAGAADAEANMAIAFVEFLL